MTDKQKQIIGNMSEEERIKQIIVTTDKEILEYLYGFDTKSSIDSAMVEYTPLDDFGGE